MSDVLTEVGEWQAKANALRKGRQPLNLAMPTARPPAGPTFRLQQAAAFVANYVAPDYVIDGILQRARVYSLTGATGHGKTAVMLAAAVHVVTGRTIAGREVEQGPVVYLAAENSDDLRARLLLLADCVGLDLPTLPLHFVDGAFDLMAGLDEVRRLVSEIGGAALIVADTGQAFAAASGIADDNANMAMLSFASALRGLTELPGRPCTVVLMHPVKRVARQDELLPRGGGAFLAEVDGNLTMFAEGARTTTELSWTGKFRGPVFDAIHWALESGTCARLVDAKGRQMPNVWARAIDDAAVEAAAEKTRRDEDELLTAMLRHPGLSMARWAAALGWHLRSGDPAKQRVQRALERLAGDKLVAQRRGKWALTKAGQIEAKKAAP